MSRLIRCNIVSELGIEKVVVELNSFRQRTAMIKEEIAKVSRALNERAGQLNDLVNKSLGQLKEQLGGTTLSGYLSLQGRYQSGDMNDQDYTQQKDYYRGELQNMIRKLDESKKLMMIMAQLDSRSPGAQAPPGQFLPRIRLVNAGDYVDPYWCEDPRYHNDSNRQDSASHVTAA